MHNFADAIQDSPFVNTAHHAIRFLSHHATSQNMVSFYIYIAAGLLAPLMDQTSLSSPSSTEK